MLTWAADLVCLVVSLFYLVNRFHTRAYTECRHGLLLFVVHRLMRSAWGSPFSPCRKYAGSIASLLVAYGLRSLFV